MKITNENFFELNDDKHDDEVNENKSETKQTATDRLRNELRSLFELDDDETDNEVYEKTSVFDETDNEVDEKPNVVNETDEKPVVGETDSEADETSAVDETDNETDEKQSVIDETDETPSAADEPDTEVDENPSVVDKTDEKPSADEPDTEADEKLVGDETANEADTNESAAKQTAAVDKTDENKPVHKRTAAERLRDKLMALRMQDDGKTDVSASEVPVNNHEDAFEGETKVPDDDKIVDSQNAAPIDTAAKDDVAQPADDIDTAAKDDVAQSTADDIDATPSKDDVAQLAADDINTAAEDDVPQQAVDDIDAAANDAASSEDDVSQQDAGDIAARYVVSPEELKEDYQDNDTLPELPTNDDESDTNDDKPDVTCDEPDTDDESDTNGEPDALTTTNGDKPDEADERIQLKKPDDKNSKKSGSRKILAVVGGVAFALVATTTAVGVGHMHSTTSQSQTASSRTAVPAKKTAASSSRSVDGSSLNAVKEKLTATAKATSQPYMVQVTTLGGGYTMGVITYYPNDATKTYMDYSVTAPKTPGAVTDDKKAQDINKKLSSSLPTINKTITVIDSSKVSMNTYKQSDGSYHTILLYDNKPFGFVTTKADGSMINNVTTYYIQNVQKKNK